MAWQDAPAVTDGAPQSAWASAPAVDAAPAAAPGPAPTKFPYDEPGATYGNILPIERDAAGDLHLAFPELIRAPYRGAIEGGQRLLGNRPEEYGKAATADETAAVMVLALGMAGGVTGETAPGVERLLRDTGTGTKPPLTAAPGPETLAPAAGKAVAQVAKRIGQDAAAGGKKPEEIYDAIIAGRAAGKPVTLADVGDRNVGKLAGSVARAPGPAATFVENTTKERLTGAGERLSGDVDRYIASGPTMRQTVEQLRADQKAAAAPLYAEALKPGSVAPLEKQFEDAFADASRSEKEARQAFADANRQMTLAAAEKSRAGDNVYMANRALRAEANARFELQEAQKLAQSAAEAKQATLARLRDAQTAIANGERGGIWSPRVQQFLDDPIVKGGLARGMEIQRLEALAENKPFTPLDYALDTEGNIIKTPNMRLLDAIKKGLDAILEDYRDPVTGRLTLDERGRAIEMVRKEYVKELDRVNDSYKAARDAWAGPARQQGAIKAGNKSITWHPEEVQKYWDGLSASEKPYFKMGAAQALKDAIAKNSVTAPEIRAIGRNSYDSMMKQRLRPIFDSDEQFNKFLDAVTMERTMLEKSGKFTGGSPTAERVGDDAATADAALHGAAAVGHAASGNMFGAARSALALRRQLGLWMDPAKNAEMAKLLHDPNLDLTRGPGLALLKAASGPNAIPPNLQNVFPP
jgi:hypothetical protein